MKTFTITFHHTCNYGAVFQAYALQKTLCKLGHENVIFEYPERKKKSNVLSLNIINMIRSLFFLYYSNKRKSEMETLRKSFVDFHNRMQLTERYGSMQELRDNPPSVDAYIVGSDQVWNLKGNPQFVPARMLDFGPDNVMRISYAASLEKYDYTDSEKEMVTRCLSRFKAISLREETAKDYIHNVTGLNCVRVLDPVFLLETDEWNSIAKSPRVSGPYILSYQVQHNPAMQKTVDELKRRTGYPVVSICNGPIQRVKADYVFYDVSPEEFLGLYSNASVIVSASFHGTALGLLYGKPVYSLVKKASGNRMKNLMKLFGVKDFVLDGTSEIPDHKQFNLEGVKSILIEEKRKSIKYLTDSFISVH